MTTDDTYGEVHVTLQDGRNIYWPKGDINRYAQAAVCQVTMRVKLLRKILKTHEDIPPDLRQALERLAIPIPYEAEWDSQDSLTVHNTIKKLGAEEPSSLHRRTWELCEGQIEPAKSTDLFVWACINTETGEVEMSGIQAYEDECERQLLEGWEWRRFRLVEDKEQKE